MINEGTCIAEYKVGSHLYGTNTENSDEDYSGIFIANPNYYFGLDKIEELDLSVLSKLENGKNSKDAIDKKYHEIRKFFKLAIDNNPNVIEQLFVNDDNLISSSPQFELMRENRSKFIHKGLYDKFVGYSFSQKQKLFVKRGNMKAIEEGIELLNQSESKFIFECGIELPEFNCIFENKNQHYSIGDIFIQKNITVRRALDQLNDRKNKFGNRKELVDQYDYDVKFASHSIRLLLEGKELLETGDLKFPLKQSDLILDIRKGKYNLQEFDEMVTNYETELRDVKEKSDLPNKSQYKFCNNLLIKINSEWF